MPFVNRIGFFLVGPATRDVQREREFYKPALLQLDQRQIVAHLAGLVAVRVGVAESELAIAVVPASTTRGQSLAALNDDDDASSAGGGDGKNKRTPST